MKTINEESTNCVNQITPGTSSIVNLQKVRVLVVVWPGPLWICWHFFVGTVSCRPPLKKIKHLCFSQFIYLALWIRCYLSCGISFGWVSLQLVDLVSDKVHMFGPCAVQELKWNLAVTFNNWQRLCLQPGLTLPPHTPTLPYLPYTQTWKMIFFLHKQMFLMQNFT